jgi:transketolase
VHRQRVLAPPYRTVLKPYGQALVALARQRPEIVCLTGDLTRQCEIDEFQAEFPDRFVHAGMAEANMIGVAGALARQGLMPWVHSFGVFVTRRPLDQIVNAVAYPGLPVRIVGFMPGISSPGGPSHQAIEDAALMRALPNMTVIDVADATETAQAVQAIASLPGPVYLRLKRGEIPVLFPQDHHFSVDSAQVLAEAGVAGGPLAAGEVPDQQAQETASTTPAARTAAEPTGDKRSEVAPPTDPRPAGDERSDVALLAAGMMVAPALSAATTLRAHGVATTVVNVPVLKPLDTATVQAVAQAAQAVITAENHSIIGGLGSAVAETLAEAGLGIPLRRIGLPDTFAEGARTSPYLFKKYALTVQHLIGTAWSALDRPGTPPSSPPLHANPDEYSPV